MADNETPNSIPDSFFKNQMEEGQRLRDRRITSGQRIPNISPSTRDRIMSSLMAFQQGAAATQKAIPQGDAFGGFLAGFGGGLGAPSPEAIAAERAKAEAEAQMAQFEATPIDQVSPDIANAYGLHGVPLGMVNKLSPFITSAERNKNALNIAMLREAMREDNTAITPEEEAAIKDNFRRAGVMIDQKLTGLPRSGAVNFLPKIFIDPNTGEQMVMAPRGQMMPPPVGLTEVRGRGEAARALSIELEQLRGLFNEAGPDAEGRVMGRVADFANRVFGFKPEVAAIRGVQSIMAPMVARVVGSDVGNLNITEQEAAKRAIPLMTDNDKEKEIKFAFLNKVLGKAIYRSDFFEKNRRFPSDSETPEEYRGVLKFGASGSRTPTPAPSNAPSAPQSGQPGLMRRMARPKGSTGELRPYISTDGGKTWRPE